MHRRAVSVQAYHQRPANVGQKALAFDYMIIHKRRTCFDASCFGTPSAGIAAASALVTRILCCIIKDAQSTAEAGCVHQSRGAETHGTNSPRREGPPCVESTCPQRCVRPHSGAARPCPVPRTGRDRLRRELGTKVLRNQAPGLCGRAVGRRAQAPAALPAEHRLRAPPPSSLLPPFCLPQLCPPSCPGSRRALPRVRYRSPAATEYERDASDSAYAPVSNRFPFLLLAKDDAEAKGRPRFSPPQQ